MDHQREVAVA